MSLEAGTLSRINHSSRGVFGYTGQNERAGQSETRKLSIVLWTGEAAFRRCAGGKRKVSGIYYAVAD